MVEGSNLLAVGTEQTEPTECCFQLAREYIDVLRHYVYAFSTNLIDDWTENSVFILFYRSCPYFETVVSLVYHIL